MADVPHELVHGGRTAFGVDTHGDGPPHLPSVALDEDEVPHAVVWVRGAPGQWLNCSSLPDDVEEPADAEVIGLHLQLLEAAACDILAQGGSPLGIYSVMS